MNASRGEGLRRTEEEIAQEKAAALGRAGERLEAALAEARNAAAKLLAGRGAADRERLAGEYGTARGRALEARMALVIQRETLGLRRHATVDQQFPEPPSTTELVRRNQLF